MLKNFVKLFSGDPTKKTVEQYQDLVVQVNALEEQYASLSDEAIRAKTEEFKTQVALAVEGIEDKEELRKTEQNMLEEIMPEAFALVREASKRTIGLRHYDVQIIGGAALHHKNIAEMRTGEGKTLVATLPVFLNALLGHGVHLVTVNDYLARRDARWMAPIYHALGLSVGVLQMAAVTENGKKAFIVDFEKESPHEDQRHLRMVDRVEAYKADVIFGTNSEFGFDYLRDNMTMRLDARVQRGHYFAIVDEVDNVLIDEARTPLIISGPAQGDLEWYGRTAQVVKQLKPEDYEMDEKNRSINLTEIGVSRVESILGLQLLDPERPEDLTPEQARLMGYLQQALRAQYLFHRNKDYLVQGGKVVIVDEFTGRLMPGRRWSDGLHQAVEAKEGVKVEPESVTYATVTLQNYFRMYQKLAGMTGTALTEAEEFNKIYKLEVAPIPPNLEYQSFGKDSPLVEIKAKDDEGYAYSYFAKAGDDQPIYYRRKDYPDVIYRTVEAKLRSIATEIVRNHALGRPLLVGTTSVDSSERLSNRLKAESVRRLMQYELVRDHYLRANNLEEDGRLITDLVPFNEPIDKISPDALRAFIKPHGLTSISLEDENNLQAVLGLLNLPDSAKERLKKIFQGGVPHQVLNARKHTEESQIIAGAGGFGAVTIATNMAGRGVDIKLGGEIAEEEISAANRVLVWAGYKDPFDMTLQERREALQKIDPTIYGKLEAEVKHFLDYFDDMELVKKLGGLHVIGSERHEARRIDNQLRGRAARQGDPGSSRFYLSLQDDLMRLFGGEQVSGLMERLKVDDSLPLEVRLVSNIIEGSQTRVEGANFDVRKHLLEYDDVLNQQRQQIYNQRDLIFVKEDLSEDISEMLEAEVTKRVEAGLVDEELWKIIHWLDEVQPPFMLGDKPHPSFSLSLLIEEIQSYSEDRNNVLLSVIENSIDEEHIHILSFAEKMLEKNFQIFNTQLSEKEDSLDAYFEGYSYQEIHPRDLIQGLNNESILPRKISNEQLRLLINEDIDDIKDKTEDMLNEQLIEVYTKKIIVEIEKKSGENLGIKIEAKDWDEASEKILLTLQDKLNSKRNKLLGENGTINRDINSMSVQGINLNNDSDVLRILASLSSERQTTYDNNHQKKEVVKKRFSYVFLVTKLIEGETTPDLVEKIANYLEASISAMQEAVGLGEFRRIANPETKIADFGKIGYTIFDSERINDSIDSLSAEEKSNLTSLVGKHILNESYRQLLLGIITELWVDYLTKVEALRVSIGLEAYGQRDPLVQYKSQASELYRQLLDEIKSQVVKRLFTLKSLNFSSASTQINNETDVDEIEPSSETQISQGKKRRRRR